MTAIELLDSKAFDKLKYAWRDSIDTENEPAALQAVLDAAGPRVTNKTFTGQFGPTSITRIQELAVIRPEKYDINIATKRKGGRPKGSKNVDTKPKAKPFNFDTATDLQVAQHLDRLKAEQPTEDEKLRLAVREVIKPNFEQRAPSPDGFKHFVVNLERHGYNLGTSGWKEALKAEGIQCTKVEFDASLIRNGQLDIMIR